MMTISFGFAAFFFASRVERKNAKLCNFLFSIHFFFVLRSDQEKYPAVPPIETKNSQLLLTGKGRRKSKTAKKYRFLRTKKKRSRKKMNKVLWFDYAFCCVFFAFLIMIGESQWTFPADRSISWCEMNERKNEIYRLMVFNQLFCSAHFGWRLKLCTVSASYAMSVHRRQFFILFSIFFISFLAKPVPTVIFPMHRKKTLERRRELIVNVRAR